MDVAQHDPENGFANGGVSNVAGMKPSASTASLDAHGKAIKLKASLSKGFFTSTGMPVSFKVRVLPNPRTPSRLSHPPAAKLPHMSPLTCRLRRSSRA